MLYCLIAVLLVLAIAFVSIMSLLIKREDSKILLDALGESLAFEQCKNQILHLVDDACDMQSAPNDMYNGIARALIDFFQAHYGAFFITDPKNGKLKNVAVFVSGATQTRLAVPLALAEEWAENLSLEDENPQIENMFSSQGETLSCMAINIFLLEKRLGMIVLTRLNKPFSDKDAILLKEAESIMDTALGRALLIHRNEQLIKTLRAILTADGLRDNESLSFDEVLNEAVKLLSDNVDAETGFLMLFNPVTGEMNLMNTPGIDGWGEDWRDLIRSLSEDAIEKEKTILEHGLGSGLRSVILIPLLLRGNIIGVFGAINPRNKEGFDNEDCEILEGISSQIDTAIFESRRSKKLERVLSRSVGPDMIGPLLDHADTGLLKARRRTASVLYVDIRGFTNLTETTTNDKSEELVEFLNAYLGNSVAAIYAYEGMVDNFVGDEVIGTYGTIVDQPNHAMLAVRTAIDMQKRHTTLLEQWKDRGYNVDIGIGIATGELVVGEIGTPDRSKFTYVGKSGNLGARLCSGAKAGEVIISLETGSQLTESFKLEPIDVDCKGIGLTPALKVLWDPN